MAIFRRGSDTAEAVYARMLDGEHLWLAVRGDGPLLLRRGGAADLELPTEPQADAEGPLLTARFALAEALADIHDTKLELRLFAGPGRRATPVTYAAAAPAGPGLAEPTTRDRRSQFRIIEADGRWWSDAPGSPRPSRSWASRPTRTASRCGWTRTPAMPGW